MSHYNLASAYHSNNEFAQAREHFQVAINLDPEYADAYYNLGICFQEEGDVAQAREMYETALRLDKDMGEAEAALLSLEENHLD
mmetsp:Transcript_13771/g.40250  ORF Transcript_13771/g.40250 Transcript_13771/m.40250 type:complete len:84 (-) Transcript_13771:420-671(-)